jgi:glutamate dehydrogenase
VARAYTIAKEVFNARDFWHRIEALDNKVSSDLQISALISMWRLLRQATRWLLNLEGRKLDIKVMIKRLAPGLNVLEKSIVETLTASEKAELTRRADEYVEGGFTRKLAERTVVLERLFPTLDVVETAARRRTDVDRVARVFFGLGDDLGLKWLRTQVESLKVVGQWHAVSRANLRNQLFSVHNGLVESVLKLDGRKKDPVAAWMKRQDEALMPVIHMLKDMKNNYEMDYPTLSVAVQALEKLTQESEK